MVRDGTLIRVVLVLAVAGPAWAATTPDCSQVSSVVCAPASPAENDVIIRKSSAWSKRTLDSTDFTVGASSITHGATTTELGQTIGDAASELATGTNGNQPATCSYGQVYINQDASTAGRKLRVCEGSNTYNVPGVDPDGRSGGQTIIGGTGSGDDLTLQSTSHATKGTVFLDDHVRLRPNVPTGSQTLVDFTATSPSLANAQVFKVLSAAGTVAHGGTFTYSYLFQDAMTHTLGSGSVLPTLASFNAQPTATITDTGVTLGIIAGLYALPSVQTAVGVANGGTVYGAYVTPTISQTAAATMSVAGVTGIYVTPTVSAAASGSATLTTLRGLHVANPTTSGAGTKAITNAYAVDVDALTTPTNVAVVRSAVTASSAARWYLVDTGGAPSSVKGKLRLGDGAITTAPTNDIEFEPTAAKVIGALRHTTANTAGVALTVQSGGATSGATDKAGGSVTIQTGLSTGTGNATIALKTPSVASATGTSDNTLHDRVLVAGTKVLTDNSAIGILDVTIGSGQMAGGTISYTIEATDGTDHQGRSGIIAFTGVNKASAMTCGIGALGTSVVSVSAGTLAETWTNATGSGKCTVTLNANTSLTPSTGYPRVTFTVQHHSGSATSLTVL